MLYNIEQKKVQSFFDCYRCSYYDITLKKCNGLNKCCFIYDEKTKTIIDGVTKMPLDITKLKGE